MAASSLIGLIGGPLGGVILDYFYRKTPKARGFVPASYVFISAIFAVSAFMLKSVPLFVLANFTLAMVPACYHVITQEIVHAKYRASSYGALVIVLQLGGTLGSFITGVLSSMFGIQLALACVAGGGLLLSTVFFLCVTRFYTHELESLRSSEILEANVAS